ncbi:MAG: hypothetical protein GC168_17580 [Candidatus Hydrogenedens sp.]|nr:hypothetical protein [Candidatus Hydrogenedens sp.]
MRRLGQALAIVIALLALPWGYVYLNTFWNDWTGVTTDFSGSALLQDKPAPWTEPAVLRIATFNIQDLLVVAKDHVDRMEAIALKLGELDPDVVGFQEAFIEKHREVLIAGLKKTTRLQHFQYYASAKMGSGVLIASAYPIQEVYFHRYAASNPWYKVWEGDYWAGKGVGLARIALPDGRLFDVYDTHVQAGYGVAANRVVQEQQLTEMAGFINASKLGTVPAFALGDYNSRIGSAAYENLVTGADLVRTMAIDSSIDHVLAARNPLYTFEVEETIEIKERVKKGDKEFDLSDHYGYLSVVRVAPVAPVENSGVS